MPSSSAKFKTLLTLAKHKKLNFFRSALLHMKTRVSLKSFETACVWNVFLGFNSPQTLLNVIPFEISVSLINDFLTVLTKN